MNPDEIKRRELFGLSSLMLGVFGCLCGLASLLFSMPIGLLLFGLGAGLTAAGLFTLNNIPDVISDELW